LSASGNQFVAPVRQQLQRDIVIVGSHCPQVLRVQRCPRDRIGVCLVGLVAVTSEICRMLRRYIAREIYKQLPRPT
jgi:hypothetical protein